MLRHRLASTLLFVLRQRPARLLLPELVRHEVERHLVSKHRTAVKKGQQAVGEIRQILGAARDFDDEPEEAVRTAFAKRMQELHDLLEESALTERRTMLQLGGWSLRSRRQTRQRVNNSRDSLLWQQIKRAALSDDVVFVTSDAGFMEGKERHLAASLQAELDALGACRGIHLSNRRGPSR